jgi:1-pyrroline-5-carboxylate dehydrogenase
MALAGGPTGAALVTGNTVVLKPAEDAPWTPTLFAQIVAEVFEEAGVPAGVFNMVTGGKETGRALVEHPDVAGITFTGSYKVGMEIYRESATGPHARPVLAEMGGKNAAIITRNADLEKAVQGVVRSAFGLQGQKCSACSRVFVDKSIHAQFVDRLVAATEAVQVGDPSQADVWMGPLSTARAYANYQAAVAELAASGDLRTGGALLDPAGYYVAPTVVDNLPADHEIWQKELFLPIVCVAGVSGLDEALARANDVPFGLTAGIYSEDSGEVERFFDTVEAGVVYANRESGATTGAWPGYQPFGGWKGSSTTGRGSGGAHYLQQYMREQSQTVVR